MEKKSNTNLLLIALVLVMLVTAITIVGVILLMNSKNTNRPTEKNTVARQNVIEEDPTEEPHDIAEATDFDLKFLKMENSEKNNLYSPLSIRYALYMLRDGADGNTLKEIEDALGDATSVNKYKNIKNVLSFANSVFIRDTYEEFVVDSYIDKVEKNYDAEVIFDKFESAKNVNEWIENKTLGQIKNLLSDNVFGNPNLEMILINALAIDMEWEDAFECEDTIGKKFYLSDGKEMNATTLVKKATSDSVSYYKDDDVTAVSMDLKEYDDRQLSFIAIMPNEDKLTDYVEDFEIEELDKINKKLKSSADEKGGVQVSIPKFSYDYSLNFEEDLKKLGIKDAFELEDANFYKMGKTGLYVSKVIHKANIDLSEEGVKAAAATVIMMFDKAMPMEKYEPVEITIDKPFLYFIQDKESGEIWFVGTLYEPNKWEDDRAEYMGQY